MKLKSFRVFWAWFDFWIGLYYDIGHKTLYICPLPTIVFRFEFEGIKSENKHREDRVEKWVPVGASWPDPYRMVLVATDKFETSAPAVNVGYMKYAAGDLECPYFVCPGAQSRFKPLYWSDCLGDDFRTPNWQMNQPQA